MINARHIRWFRNWLIAAGLATLGLAAAWFVGIAYVTFSPTSDRSGRCKQRAGGLHPKLFDADADKQQTSQSLEQARQSLH